MLLFRRATPLLGRAYGRVAKLSRMSTFGELERETRLTYGMMNRRVFTQKGHNVYTRVHELIDPITNQWDEELVGQTFMAIDIQRIMEIPLPSHEMEDFVEWSPAKTRNFSGQVNISCGMGKSLRT
jgi:hypothetical protein